MNNRLNDRERKHLAKVKEMACAVCNASGPSEAHHVEQGLQYTCIPLCADCHRGSRNGFHGERAMWKLNKATELTCLDWTIRRLMA